MMNGVSFARLKGQRAAKLAELSLLSEDLNELTDRLDRVAVEFEALDAEVSIARAEFESKIKKPVVFTGIEEVISAD